MKMSLSLSLIAAMSLSLIAGCGEVGFPSLGSGASPSEVAEERFERQTASVRLVVGEVLMGSAEDEGNLLEHAWELAEYPRVECVIDGVRWSRCYSASGRCGGGSFPTACFSEDGGLRACVSGAMGSDCAATTLDGMGERGAPLTVYYCGASVPAGRAVTGAVPCDKAP